MGLVVCARSAPRASACSRSDTDRVPQKQPCFMRRENAAAPMMRTSGGWSSEESSDSSEEEASDAESSASSSKSSTVGAHVGSDW